MNIDDLKAFVTVADCGGFGLAGDKLGIAQSVVSKRMKRLEAMLGGRLIDRSVRTRIVLTREGTLFLDEARQTVANAERTMRNGRDIVRGGLGSLRVGFVFSAILTGLVTRTARSLKQHLPALTLELQMLETPEQLRALAESRIDIGFVRPRLSYPPGTSARLVHSEALIVGMQKNHRLASAPTLTGRDLAGEVMIVPQFHEEVGLIDTLKVIARRGGFDMPELIRTDDFVTAAALTAAGLGIVLAPSSLKRLDLPELAYRPLAEADVAVQLAMVWRDTLPKLALECLIEREFAGSEPPIVMTE